MKNIDWKGVLVAALVGASLAVVAGVAIVQIYS